MNNYSDRNGYSIFSLPLLLVFLVSFPCLLGQPVAEDDVRCLRGIKESLKDPHNKLIAWRFLNSTVKNQLCLFPGTTCWSATENRLFQLHLKGFGLSGTIPKSLKYCGSLVGLDLSDNQLSGMIPDLCSWMPYLTSIDLSGNMLSGSIPPFLANCTYLNKLSLENNSLSGDIPYQLSSLQRLKEFSVAHNDLKGTIPSAFDKYGRDAFWGNSGLCGGPLEKCGGYGLSKKSLTIILAAAGFGAAFSVCLVLGLWWR